MAAKLKIALVNPRMEGPYPPLGLGYIASYLREYGAYDYDIRIIDGNACDGVEEETERFGPDIVGFTGHSPQIKEAVELSRAVRRWRPEVFQVIGGVHVSADPAGTLTRGAFDAAVLGEGERTFTELVDTIAGGAPDRTRGLRGTAFIEGGEVVINPAREQITDLDAIPYPARDLFAMDYYMGPSFGVRGKVSRGVTSITSSRGCPYNCLFCGVNIVFKKVRQFSRPYCIGEITELVERYGARALYFADDTFTVNKAKVAEFCDMLIASKLASKVKWTAQARANLIDWDDLEMLRLMKAAGCIQLEYGFESGSDRVLGILKQNRVTLADNQRAIDVTHASGLRTLGTFIVGTPGETEEDVEMTREFVRRNLTRLDYFQTFICTPFPGSDLYRTCVERGLVEPDYFDEIARREKDLQPPVFTDTIDREVVVETLRHLDYLGLRKVSLRDKALWVLYHLTGKGDVSHHDRFYIFKRLFFYARRLIGPAAPRAGGSAAPGA